MTATIVRIILASTLLTLAAIAAELALRELRRPLRAVWSLTMIATALTTLLLLAGGSLPLAAPGAVVELVSIGGMASTIDGGVTRAADGTQGTFAFVWISLTLVVLSVLGVGAWRQRRRLRHGVARTLHGIRVLVTNHFGPAVTGVLRPVIVVPEWLLELPLNQQRLVLRHEAEHAAAGDHRLSALALLLCCLVPWNPLLWYQLRRVRLAVEFDCDARVLRRESPTRAAYGLLLIDVAERTTRGMPLATTLVHPRSSLERRIRMLTRGTIRPLHAAAWAVAASGLIIAACADATKATAPEEPAPTAAKAVAEIGAFEFRPTDGVSTLRPLDKVGGTATFTPDDRQDTPEAWTARVERNGHSTLTRRKVRDTGVYEASISGKRLVRFEMQVGVDGRATNIRFGSDTPDDLKPLARQTIESSQFRRRVDQRAGEWTPAILALP